MTVIGAAELEHPFAAGRRSRKTDSGHRRFRPGIDEPDHLGGRDTRDNLLGEIDFRLRRRAIARPALRSSDHRRDDIGVSVASDQRAPGADVVDESVAVDVDQSCSRSPLDEERIATDGAHRRTGLFTPPGMIARARSKSSFERAAFKLAVLLFPARVIRGEVVKADLLELRRGVERGAFVLTQARNLGDAVQHRIALFFRAAVRHREDAVRPIGIGRPLVAMRDTPHRRHGPSSEILSSGTFHTPIPFAEKPARR